MFWYLRSPHFGVFWEAAVKSFKYQLLRNVSNTLLSHGQTEAYIDEIGAILNSHPLSPLSSDSNYYLPLTPGHFLPVNDPECALALLQGHCL